MKKDMNYKDIDKSHVWHPYTQALNADENLVIARGEGAYLVDIDEKKYLDATSSWWTNTHGHAHPYLAKSLYQQASTLEHVIFAGYSHPPALHLVEHLKPYLPNNQKRFFFSDNGSTAVEVALKMAFQFWLNNGQERNLIVAFEDAYHGDTFGSMSVSGRGLFTDPFKPYLFDVLFIPIPTNETDLSKALSILSENEHKIAAFIYEPLLQGAAGMKVYQSSHLEKLLQTFKTKDILLIADEVFTGFGRTGKMFASEYMAVQPDVMCFSKGLTAGMLPMGLTTAAEFIYDVFLSSDATKTFFHGHSFTGNPLGCSVAIASLELFKIENTLSKIETINSNFINFKNELSQFSFVSNVAVLGAMLRFELDIKNKGYLSTIKSDIIHFYRKKGIMIRPLGNIIYFLPPYCVSQHDLLLLFNVTIEFLEEFKNKLN